MDARYQDNPYQLFVVTSVGRVGPRGQPTAERVLRAEWDGAELDRLNPTNVNLNLGHWMNFEDLGAP